MKPITESTETLTEATTSTTSGMLEIEFITPGWGSSGYYSPEVVEAAAPLFAPGTHMYLDHPTASDDAQRPERSVRDLAAIVVEASFNAESGGVRGMVRPVATYRDLLTDEAFAKSIGVSIRGSATDITVGEAEGRRGPIVEGLSDITSVDFVTRAGRGGKVLQVLESARFVAEATANDRAEQLSNAVRAAYPGEGVYAYVTDMDAERSVVWYQVSPAEGPSRTFEHTYDIDDNDVGVTLTGEPVEVARVTRYVPVTPAGLTESMEDTMPQIEESRLRSLEADAGRVPTLEESVRNAEAAAVTAQAERDQARRELAESKAHGTAVTSARARIVAANATLPAATVDRIVAESTRTVPLTDAGALDETALHVAVDAARTAEESYLASLAPGGKLVGFGESTTTTTESAKPATNAWGRPMVKGA